jgi:hypothetical protein
MTSHGADETARLKANVQDQLSRLLTQLQDLEDLRDEIDDDEYAEVRGDTLDQLREFDAQLNKMAQGDLTLVSELGAIKLALESAVREAFRTPEVIRMFASKEPTALRGRLARLHEEVKLGRLTESAFRVQAVEVIVALKRLGEEVRTSILPQQPYCPGGLIVPATLLQLVFLGCTKLCPPAPYTPPQLTADERHFLDASTDTRRQFEAADRAIGESAVWGVAAAASKGGAAVAATTGGAGVRRQ